MVAFGGTVVALRYKEGVLAAFPNGIIDSHSVEYKDRPEFKIKHYDNFIMLHTGLLSSMNELHEWVSVASEENQFLDAGSLSAADAAKVIAYGIRDAKLKQIQLSYVILISLEPNPLIYYIDRRGMEWSLPGGISTWTSRDLSAAKTGKIYETYEDCLTNLNEMLSFLSYSDCAADNDFVLLHIDAHGEVHQEPHYTVANPLVKTTIAPEILIRRH